MSALTGADNCYLFTVVKGIYPGYNISRNTLLSELHEFIRNWALYFGDFLWINKDDMGFVIFMVGLGSHRFVCIDYLLYLLIATGGRNTVHFAVLSSKWPDNLLEGSESFL